jgi:1-acyl-sn-glycerol-3-phosphate acyltransferase
MKSDAPVIPVAVTGSEGFPTWKLKRWRQTGVRIRIGQPFRFHTPAERDRKLLRQMTDEAMYRLACLLPESRRGEYADLTAATTETLEFL